MNGIVQHECSGSSPRVRGTALDETPGVVPVRFIPACAGNRLCKVILCMLYPVHPRVCGEQPSTRLQAWSQYGSSPRVRGTVFKSANISQCMRFIPACAGNRLLCDTAYRSQSVHPRVCGEQRSSLNTLSAAIGSSPRVRGTDERPFFRSDSIWFIPACAGNSHALTYRI